MTNQENIKNTKIKAATHMIVLMIIVTKTIMTRSTTLMKTVENINKMSYKNNNLMIIILIIILIIQIMIVTIKK